MATSAQDTTDLNCFGATIPNLQWDPQFPGGRASIGSYVTALHIRKEMYASSEVFDAEAGGFRQGPALPMPVYAHCMAYSKVNARREGRKEGGLEQQHTKTGKVEKINCQLTVRH